MHSEVTSGVAMTEPRGAVRGAPERLSREPAPRPAVRSRIPVLALPRPTGYAGSQQKKPGVLPAAPAPAPTPGRSGDTATCTPTDVGVFDGEA